MLEIKVGDRVLVSDRVVHGPEAPVGVVTEIVPRIDDVIYIVRLDNNQLIKCIENDLTLIPETNREDMEDTITISKEDLEKALTKVTNPLNYEDTIGKDTAIVFGLSGLIISKALVKELFGADND